MNKTSTRRGTPYPGGERVVALPAPAPSVAPLRPPALPKATNWNAPSFETMDRVSRAVIARFTQGISPHAFFDACFDWASHLAFAPGRLLELGLEAIEAGARLTRFVTRGTSNEVEFALPAAARRSPFHRPCLAKAALFLVGAGLSRAGGVVEEHNARSAWHDAKERRAG